MLAIILSFFAGAAVSLGLVRLAASYLRDRHRRRAVSVVEREAALRAELVDHQMQELLGAPARPYFTASTVAAARRALEPILVIKVKP